MEKPTPEERKATAMWLRIAANYIDGQGKQDDATEEKTRIETINTLNETARRFENAR